MMFQEDETTSGKISGWVRTLVIPGTGRNLDWRQQEQWGGGWQWIDKKACRGQITKGLDCYIKESCLYSKGNGKLLRDFKQWKGLIKYCILGKCLCTVCSRKIKEWARLKAPSPLMDHYSNIGKRKWLSEVGKCLYDWRFVYHSERYLSSKNLQ